MSVKENLPEYDKLKEYIDYLEKAIIKGTGIPLSILFGSTSIPEDPAIMSIGEKIIPENEYYQSRNSILRLEDNEEVATEDPKTHNISLDDLEAELEVGVRGHPMDIHYPHTCFQCKRELIWYDLFIRNQRWEYINYDYNNKTKKQIKIISVKDWLDNLEIYKHLKQLWCSSVVQFYCCVCYDDMIDKGGK